MTNHGCINGTLEGTDKYSSPVPFVGLYIAIASTVCFLLMLYDIVYGFIIKRQRWLPCKLLKLNSITLSFIGVVVKLTLDLTTHMPSAMDQLSKLTGTTSLCIYMCYIFPSLGDMKDRTNMYALSLLVITVFVNMCLQLSTGVIVLFIPEHIAVLCLMLVLLLILWQFVWASKTEYNRLVGVHKTRFIEGTMAVKENFMRRLKVCYLYSYDSNPQFVACREKECGVGGDLSVASLVILVQAAVRSIVLKKEMLCRGKSSDYHWSMEAIVATQFATVAIGTFACYSRRCTMTGHVKYHVSVQKLIGEPYLSNPILKLMVLLVNAINRVYDEVISVNYWFFSVPIRVFNWIKLKMKCVSTNRKTDTKLIGEFESLFDKKRSNGLIVERDFVGLQRSEWRQRKSVDAMENLIEESKKRTSDLCILLSRIYPQSRESAGDQVIGNGDVVINHPRYRGSRPKEWMSFGLLSATGSRLLPLVALVRLAEVAVPKSLSRNLILTLREGFETLYFIEKHERHNIDIEVAEIAKAAWMIDDFRLLLPKNLRDSGESDDGLTLDHAFRVIEYIDNKVHLRNLMDMQVRYIRMLLTLPTFSSVEELGYFMEDLFVDLLDPMLAQLPEAIFNAVYGSPVDEFEQRVQQSLEHFCKFESWDGIYRWKPPKGCQNCTGLVTTEMTAGPRVESFAEAFANATPEQECTMLGEFLYTLVDQLEHHMAAKVTRMLMKLDPLIVMLLISSPEALKAKVAEAMELLRNNDDAMFVVSKFEYEKFTS